MTKFLWVRLAFSGWFAPLMRSFYLWLWLVGFSGWPIYVFDVENSLYPVAWEHLTHDTKNSSELPRSCWFAHMFDAELPLVLMPSTTLGLAQRVDSQPFPRHPCRSPKRYFPGPTLEISGNHWAGAVFSRDEKSIGTAKQFTSISHSDSEKSRDVRQVKCTTAFRWAKQVEVSWNRGTPKSSKTPN